MGSDLPPHGNRVATKDYQRGMVDAIERITALLAQHFPASGDNPNELADAPTLL